MAKEFEVEAIVAQRKGKGGKTQYEIKWRGYTENTWEPESSLKSCTELLEKFKKENKDINGTPSNSTPSTPRSTRPTRGATTSAARASSPALAMVSQTASSTSSLRSARSTGGGSSNEKKSLEEKLKDLVEASKKKGNRKRGAAPDDNSIPVKIIKKDELEELEIWTMEKYKESQKNDDKSDEDEMEKFLDKKIIGIIGHYPGDKQSFYVITTEGETNEKITDSVYGVECILATRLFPKIVVNYHNNMVISMDDKNGKASTSK